MPQAALHSQGNAKLQKAAELDSSDLVERLRSLDAQYGFNTHFVRRPAAENLTNIILLSLLAGPAARGALELRKLLPKKREKLKSEILIKNYKKDGDADQYEKFSRDNSLWRNLVKLISDNITYPALFDISKDEFANAATGNYAGFVGGNQTIPEAVPAAWLGIPLAAAGAVGSYAVTDQILDARRKYLQKQKEKEKEKEYEELVRDMMKRSNAELLDDIVDFAMTKKAQHENRNRPGLAGDVMGYTQGVMLAAALLSMLGAGALTYPYFRSRMSDKVSRKALDIRDKQYNFGMPSQLPVVVVPADKPALDTDEKDKEEGGTYAWPWPGDW